MIKFKKTTTHGPIYIKKNIAKKLQLTINVKLRGKILVGKVYLIKKR